MRVVIEESGKQRIIQIQEFVHYANVTSEIGDSKYLAMSQKGISDAIWNAQRKRVFEFTMIPNPPPLDNPDNPDNPELTEKYQEYLNYLVMVQESESNRYPELSLTPTFKEYLDYIGFEYSKPAIEPVDPIENSIINENALGYLLITSSDLEILSELPKGFTFKILARHNANIKLNTEVFVHSGEDSEVILELETYEFIKISENEWFISRA